MVGVGVVLFAEDDSGKDRLTRSASGSDAGEVKKKPEPAKPEPTLPLFECPADLTNCEAATGKIIYVEAVDPDGDGDAHFVTISNQSITATAITVFDVGRDLRPDPLPGRGDLIGGYGPVYEGSHGQKQIEVIEFFVAK